VLCGKKSCPLGSPTWSRAAVRPLSGGWAGPGDPTQQAAPGSPPHPPFPCSPTQVVCTFHLNSAGLKLKLILFYINFTVTAQKTESTVGTQDRLSSSLRKHLGENQVPVRETPNKPETLRVPAGAQQQSLAHRAGSLAGAHN
jgi:hypothetical protein